MSAVIRSYLMTRAVDLFIPKRFNNMASHISQRLEDEQSTVKGVIFDMDGTLTIPVLNFKELRRRLGIDNQTDILEYANSFEEGSEKHKDVVAIIDNFEDEGNSKLKLQPNIHEVFSFLKEKSICTALITRNNVRAVQAFLGKFILEDKFKNFGNSEEIFSQILTRDFLPFKPNPASANHVCSIWNLPKTNVIFVGDDIQDILCGRNAGITTVLKMKESNQHIRHEADYCIDNLSELIDIIKSFSRAEK